MARTDAPFRAFRARQSRRDRAQREIDHIDRLLAEFTSPADDASIAAYTARRAILEAILR